MSDRNVKTAAEAICGALYRVDFEHLGDTDEGRTTWFTRGTKPKSVRIRVERARLYPMVFVHIEFLNQSVKPARVGNIQMQVDCTGNDHDIEEATTQAVVRCLEVFKDVLEGKGVAGKKAATAQLN